jgi:hypothetical protein
MAATYSNRHRKLEKYVEVVRQDGLNTDMNVNIGVNGTPNLWVAGNLTVGGTTGAANAIVQNHASKAAINSTGTATAAQVATGYITSTSAAATTITLPTGTLLGTQLGATQGTVLDLIVDNTAGANTVTVAVATNGILSAAAVAGSAAGFGLLTVPSGVTGVGRFTLMFSSATAYVFSRTA